MVFSKSKILALGIVATLFCACSATTYQENGSNGGYSDFRVAEDSFFVTFKGNGYTDSDTVLKYALKRSSELTIQNGFLYFSIQNSQDASKRSFVSIGDLSSSASMYEVVSPGVTINIKCYMERPVGLESIDASEYLKFNE